MQLSSEKIQYEKYNWTEKQIEEGYVLKELKTIWFLVPGKECAHY
jgi:hypothetical protein